MTAEPPDALARPQLSLAGEVDDAMLRELAHALREADVGAEPLVLELTTPGGDADVARRMVADLRLHEKRTGRPMLFLGKGMVYSAGVTVMSAFAPGRRWLAQETSLLVHGRNLTKTVDLDGPLEASRLRIQALLAELDHGLRLEREDFERLVAGTPIDVRTVSERARTGWFLRAAEAAALGLIAGVV